MQECKFSQADEEGGVREWDKKNQTERCLKKSHLIAKVSELVGWAWLCTGRNINGPGWKAVKRLQMSLKQSDELTRERVSSMSFLLCFHYRRLQLVHILATQRKELYLDSVQDWRTFNSRTEQNPPRDMVSKFRSLVLSFLHACILVRFFLCVCLLSPVSLFTLAPWPLTRWTYSMIPP